MINVLSLFDGMSCGQQALERAGIPVANYYASEIDKYAIKVTQANYPNTIQLGSVVNVDGYSLPKIDLLIGGSPCQSFSFAGKRKGMSTKDEQEILSLDHYLRLKSEEYEFEGQSYLFWEYMRLLNELRTKNPNVFFFLENVEMGEKWEKVLSRAIGVNGIHINSALVSAQNRKRIYWTNIGMKPSGLFGDFESIIQQPKDKGILLKDVLEKEVDEKYFLSEINEDFSLDINDINKIEIREIRQLSTNNKSNGDTQPYQQDRIYDINGISPALSAGKSDLMITSGTLRTHKDGEGFREVHSGKGATIPARAREDGSGQNVVKIQSRIRRLTPIECERLQTVKDGYTNQVSDSQRYKMLGNGWTVDVIVHFFNYLKQDLKL